jgi:dienelactone hydrolase
MKCVLSAAAIVVIFSAMAHAEAQEAKSDVAISWQKGVAYVPGKFFTTSPPEIKTNKPYPVVLYMHGCNGIGPTDRRWGPFLKGLGFIVVQPDSFARDRPKSCDPATHTGGLFPGVYKMRIEEVDYAREQIAKSAWADQKNIFLMGHSEGGITVSLITRADFRGVVISAWHCGSRTGLRTAVGIPVLAIDHSNDPWFPGVAGGGCGKLFGDRPHSKMITLPGRDHDTFEFPAQKGLETFLKDLVSNP